MSVELTSRCNQWVAQIDVLQKTLAYLETNKVALLQLATKVSFAQETVQAVGQYFCQTDPKDLTMASYPYAEASYIQLMHMIREKGFFQVVLHMQEALHILEEQRDIAGILIAFGVAR